MENTIEDSITNIANVLYENGMIDDVTLESIQNPCLVEEKENTSLKIVPVKKELKMV